MFNKSSKEPKLYPQCEACWVHDNSRWEPEGVTVDGQLIAQLVAVAVPEMRLTNLTPEICADCGDVTVVGIYIEKEEGNVPFDVDSSDAVSGD